MLHSPTELHPQAFWENQAEERERWSYSVAQASLRPRVTNSRLSRLSFFSFSPGDRIYSPVHAGRELHLQVLCLLGSVPRVAPTGSEKVSL